MLENLLLFPGVIAHELGHLLACLLCGVRVISVKLWGLREAYIRHEEPGVICMFFIAMFPFVLNTALALVCLYIGNIQIFTTRNLYYILISYWFALSFAYHSFPSFPDVQNMYSVLSKRWFGAMVGHFGILTAILAWLFFIPLYIPALILVFFVYLFSQVPGLGLVWFIILFLFLAMFMGL